MNTVDISQKQKKSNTLQVYFFSVFITKQHFLLTLGQLLQRKRDVPLCGIGGKRDGDRERKVAGAGGRADGEKFRAVITVSNWFACY